MDRYWPLVAVGLLLGSSTLTIAQGTESPRITQVRIGAEQGNADAQFALGEAYYDGRMVAQDRQQALRWFRAAADQGHAEAQYTLGFLYQMGRGVPSDPSQAMFWYQKAASQGHAQAASSLKTLQARANKPSAPPTEATQSEGLGGKESTPAQMQARVKLLAGIADSETIVFVPKGKTSGVYTIFVDPECPPCARLFEDTAQITAEGIKVRYVLAKDSELSRRIWCSSDRAAALTAAFQAGDRGRSLPQCPSSFATRFEKTSRSLDVSSTPTTFTDHGRVLVGYVTVPMMLFNIDESYLELIELMRSSP